MKRNIPLLGDPKPDGVECAACHDTGYFWDCGGHGAWDWKRACVYCRRADRALVLTPKRESGDG